MEAITPVIVAALLKAVMVGAEVLRVIAHD
jgi:hypothetical protein